MAINAADVLTVVKARLGLADASNDDLINSYIDELQQRLLSYCNLTEVPDGLKFVWASMTIDLLKLRNPTLPVIAALLGSTMEIKAGDTTTKITANKASIETIVTSYSADLNRYRKLRW